MNRLRWVSGIVIAVLLLATGCGGAPDDSSGETGSVEENSGAAVEETADAEQIYSGNCASCHGGNLEGGMGPGLETVGANLSQEEIADIIENGRGQMPAQSQLQEGEVQELASWLAEKK